MDARHRHRYERPVPHTGVPLINGIIDILEGHTVTGTSRLIQATLLVICIATGLAVPLLLFMKNLL